MYVKDIGIMDAERLEGLKWWASAHADDDVPDDVLVNLGAGGLITKKARDEEGWVLTRLGDLAMKWARKNGHIGVSR